MQSPEGAIPSRGGETVDGCGCRTQENESIRATPPTTPCLLSGDTSENIGLSGISAHGFSCVFIIATSRSGYSREPTPPRPDAMMRAMRTSPQCKPSRTGHGRRSAPESERAIVSAPTPATGNRLPRRIRRMQHGREANDPSMRSEARRRGRQGSANPTFPCLLSGDTFEIKGFTVISGAGSHPAITHPVHRNEPCSHFACMFRLHDTPIRTRTDDDSGICPCRPFYGVIGGVPS